MSVFVCELSPMHNIENMACFLFILFSQMVANVSGCSLESSKIIADCMKNLDFNTIETLTKVRHFMQN